MNPKNKMPSSISITNQHNATTVTITNQHNVTIVTTSSSVSHNSNNSRSKTQTSVEKTMSPAPKADEVTTLQMKAREASPSHFLLKVESVSLLCKHEIHKYETGEFDAGGYKWKLIIDFNGEKTGNDDKYISSYLAISDTTSLPANWEVNAVFSIFLMNQISGKYHYSSGTRRFVSVKPEWGFPQFISKKTLNDPSNGFLINKDCVFGVEVFIIRNSAVCQSLSLRDATVAYEPDWKYSNFSKVGDVSASKQYAFVDECPKWEVRLPTTRKCHNKVGSCRKFCMLLYDAMNMKACFSVEDQTNDGHIYHKKTEVAKLETREASPSHFLMKVDSFALLGKHGMHKYETGEFDAGGYKWRLIICPNEDKTGKESNYISVYLALSNTTSLKPANWEVNAVFSIFLFDHISGNYHYSSGRTRRFQAMKTEWGISKFITKKVLMDPKKGFLIDNKCVFGAEVFIVQKSSVSECLSLKEATYPYKRDWKISNFSKLGDVWTSEQFIAEGVTWEVALYPKGNGVAKGRCLSTFIRLIDSKRVKATYSICIKDQFNKKHCIQKGIHWYSPNPNTKSCGSTRVIQLSTLEDPKNGFIINDCCLLEIEISVQAVV